MAALVVEKEGAVGGGSPAAPVVGLGFWLVIRALNRRLGDDARP